MEKGLGEVIFTNAAKTAEDQKKAIMAQTAAGTISPEQSNSLLSFLSTQGELPRVDKGASFSMPEKGTGNGQTLGDILSNNSGINQANKDLDIDSITKKKPDGSSETLKLNPNKSKTTPVTSLPTMADVLPQPLTPVAPVASVDSTRPDVLGDQNILQKVIGGDNKAKSQLAFLLASIGEGFAAPGSGADTFAKGMKETAQGTILQQLLSDIEAKDNNSFSKASANGGALGLTPDQVNQAFQTSVQKQDQPFKQFLTYAQGVNALRQDTKTGQPRIEMKMLGENEKGQRTRSQHLWAIDKDSGAKTYIGFGRTPTDGSGSGGGKGKQTDLSSARKMLNMEFLPIVQSYLASQNPQLADTQKLLAFLSDEQGGIDTDRLISSMPPGLSSLARKRFAQLTNTKDFKQATRFFNSASRGTLLMQGAQVLNNPTIKEFEAAPVNSIFTIQGKVWKKTKNGKKREVK